MYNSYYIQYSYIPVGQEHAILSLNSQVQGSSHKVSLERSYIQYYLYYTIIILVFKLVHRSIYIMSMAISLGSQACNVIINWQTAMGLGNEWHGICRCHKGLPIYST